MSSIRGCAGAERMPMGVTLNGKRWETFRCGRGLKEAARTSAGGTAWR